jgi:hypothetical protein
MPTLLSKSSGRSYDLVNGTFCLRACSSARRPSLFALLILWLSARRPQSNQHNDEKPVGTYPQPNPLTNRLKL